MSLRTALRTALRVVLIAGGTFIACVGGVLLTLGTASASSDTVDGMVVTACALRSVLALVVLVALTWAYRIRDRKAVDSLGRPYTQVLVAAGIAYFVNLASWDGHMLFGQLIVGAGLPAMLFDFVVWMAVAAAGTRLGDQVNVQAKTAAIPYV